MQMGEVKGDVGVKKWQEWYALLNLKPASNSKSEQNQHTYHPYIDATHQTEREYQN